MPMFATDEVFIEAPPETIDHALLHIHEAHAWWPGGRARGGYGWTELDLPTGKRNERIRFKARIDGARPGEGFSWLFEAGALAGRAEFWLERYRHGTIIHHFLTVDPAGPGPSPASRVRRYRWAIRRGLNGLKDHLDARTNV